MSQSSVSSYDVTAKSEDTIASDTHVEHISGTKAAKLVLEDQITPSKDDLQHLMLISSVNTNDSNAIKNSENVESFIDNQMVFIQKSHDSNDSATGKMLRMEGSGSDDSIGTRLTIKGTSSSNVSSVLSSSSNSRKIAISPTFHGSIPPIADGIASARDTPSNQRRLQWKKGFEPVSPVMSSHKRPPVPSIHDQMSPSASSKSVGFESGPIFLTVPNEFTNLVRTKIEVDRVKNEQESSMFESRGLQRVNSNDSNSVAGWDFTYRSNASVGQQHHGSKPNSHPTSRTNSVALNPGSLTSSYDLEQQTAATVSRRHVISQIESSLSSENQHSSPVFPAKMLEFNMDGVKRFEIAGLNRHSHIPSGASSPFFIRTPASHSQDDIENFNQSRPSSESYDPVTITAAESDVTAASPDVETKLPMSIGKILSQRNNSIHLSFVDSSQVSSITNVLKRQIGSIKLSQSPKRERSLDHIDSSKASDGYSISSNKFSDFYLAVFQPALEETKLLSMDSKNCKPRKAYMDSVIHGVKRSRLLEQRKYDHKISGNSDGFKSPTDLSPQTSIGKISAADDIDQEVSSGPSSTLSTAPLLTSLLVSTNPSQSWFSKVFGFSNPGNESQDHEHPIPDTQSPSRRGSTASKIESVKPRFSFLIADDRSNHVDETENESHSNPTPNTTEKTDSQTHSEGQSESNQEKSSPMSISYTNAPEEEAVHVYKKETQDLLELLMATLAALDFHTDGEMTKELAVQLSARVLEEMDNTL